MPTKDANSPLAGFTFEELMAEVGDQPTSAQTHTLRHESVDKSSRQSGNSVDFNILKNFGKLSNRKNAASFTIVNWGGYHRYDLRAWSEDYSVPFKGLSFSEEEIILLKKALLSYSPQRYTTPLAVVDMGKTKVKMYHTICELSSSVIKGVTWTKKASVADWGYGQKFDFRRWTENYGKCSKGICLNSDEVKVFISILSSISL